MTVSGKGADALSQLHSLLQRIEDGEFYSAETVLTSKEINDLFTQIWAAEKSDARPTPCLFETRVRLSLRALAAKGTGAVKVDSKLPYHWRQEQGDWRSTLLTLRKKQSDVQNLLTPKEIDMILGLLTKRGFGHSSLPVADIYSRGRRNSRKASGNDFQVEHSDWREDDIGDLIHYAVTSRHQTMNQIWQPRHPLTIYKSWFAQARQTPSGSSELHLYRGVFAIFLEDGLGTKLLRTCHLQRYDGGPEQFARHDGHLFRDHDKFMVLGFRRDLAGNQSPQTIMLDGRNTSGMLAGVFQIMGGWQTAYDVFELVREDGLVGTGIVMILDDEMNRNLKPEMRLRDILSALCDPGCNYRKCIEVTPAEYRATKGTIVSTNGDKRLTGEENQALDLLLGYDEGRIRDVVELIRKTEFKPKT